ncbi:LysR family transcriptional regulator [Anaerocolumna aminovalerica]|jgi:DNA-binding transcriptional LysR family regulator|uniref:DNA-binding transcriptional regulator, LysR family n=1 Tax=Anaerocolumna aminovalerica TaxID=1527 RepID=A0A1I5GTU6_9FIRM|nr:LysR family transcriptional regulator [Anaerocolumna aminovalerica]MBU5330932.1 LysR family transcriptional regulator [Anaerocolumna aminovalerica]MDU6264130.1 LysR family transcriptional regulator [Anaerocolumna aminovalerica]SFO39313.1 DNA-binding transcriptional regulator, LysR family [Anaerocolumna aminovalerica]
MDIKQLKYFLTIAEEGQITSAAKKLNMAQPPLSQQLKLLEEELGVKLVERGSRHLKLTDTGKILMNRARQILELTNSAVKEVKDFSKGLQGTLSIGTVSSSGATLLNESVLEFHKEYSGIEFEIYEGNTFTLIDLLNKGIIEVGIVRTPFNALNFECKYAKTEPMIAAIPREYYWEPAKYSISVSALKNKPLIIYRRFEQLICETCMEYGFEPQIFCKCDDARTALLWANAGAGIAIVPKSAFELAANSNLLYKEIENEKLKTKIAAIWVKDRYISPLASKFIESFGIV